VSAKLIVVIMLLWITLGIVYVLWVVYSGL
jgi:hypothetical protein